MSNQTIVSSLEPRAARAEAAGRSCFFFWLSVLLLSFLLIGFAPTLYLRAFIEAEPIPAYLHGHGAVSRPGSYGSSSKRRWCGRAARPRIGASA